MKRVMEMLEISESGMFASRETLNDAQEYAVDLLKSSSDDERVMAALVAIGVYHNTLVKLISASVQSMIDEDEANAS